MGLAMGVGNPLIQCSSTTSWQSAPKNAHTQPEFFASGGIVAFTYLDLQLQPSLHTLLAP